MTQVKEPNRSPQGNISGLICEEAAVKALTVLTECTQTESPDREEIKAEARKYFLKKGVFELQKNFAATLWKKKKE